MIERRSFAEIGLGLKASGRNFLEGAAAGTLLISLVIGIMMLGGFYSVQGLVMEPGLWVQLLAMAGIIFLVSLVEEVMYRALGLRLLEEMLGSWGALVLSAAVVAAFAQPGEIGDSSCPYAEAAGRPREAVLSLRRSALVHT